MTCKIKQSLTVTFNPLLSMFLFAVFPLLTNLIATANQALRKTIDVLLHTSHVGEEEVRHHSNPEPSSLDKLVVVHYVASVVVITSWQVGLV